MKRWLSLVLMIGLLLLPQALEARSHRFLDLAIEVRLGADGMVRITETHTVQFEGTFEGMYQWIDTGRGGQVRDILVSEQGRLYTQIEGDSPGPAGTYFVRQDKNEVYVDWSFEATDETRVFQVSYIMDQVVLKHEDVAEFYYQFVGRDWKEPRDYVRVVLNLPIGATMDEVAAWGHGPSHGQVTIESGRQIVWEVENLPARTFVEGRAVFPTRLVPGISHSTGKVALQSIIEEEARSVERNERIRKRLELDPFLALGVLVLLIVLTFAFWYRFGKQVASFKDKYYKELPANYSPAELAILYRQVATSRDFTATLFDLARRGYLQIEEIPGPEKRGKQVESSYRFLPRTTMEASVAALRPHEEQILRLLFEEIDPEQVTLKDFQDHVKANTKAFTEFWTAWGKEVKNTADQNDFFDKAHKKKVLWYLIPALLLVVVAIPVLILELFLTGTVLLVMGFVATITVAVAADRRSAQGYEEYTKWRAFRRYLKEFSRVETTRVGSLGIWEEVLPYAITLGVADQLLKQLELRFPVQQQDLGYFGYGWLFYRQGFGYNRIQNMTRTIDHSISNATIQSSGGRGGGFSGGGGGGFGGGGGGVR